MLGYRSNDAVLTLCQNNEAKSIEITAINEAAEELTGHGAGALVGKGLGDVTPPRIAELLAEYVEYKPGANDVGMVLSKVQSFSLLGADGTEQAYRLKVVRAESQAERMYFRLVLQDKIGERKDAVLRKAMQDNFRGHEVIDATYNLPDRNSLVKDIELTAYYSNKAELRSCFAILQLDHYDELASQYGQAQAVQFIKHIAHTCRNTLRPDDMVAVVSPQRLGVLLIDTAPESNRVVVNRLRWQIAANPYTLPDHVMLSLSVSVVFAHVGGRISEQSLVNLCEEALDEAPDAANTLLSLDESDKSK